MSKLLSSARVGRLALDPFLSHPVVTAYSSCPSAVQEQSARCRKKCDKHSGWDAKDNNLNQCVYFSG